MDDEQAFVRRYSGDGGGNARRRIEPQNLGHAMAATEAAKRTKKPNHAQTLISVTRAVRMFKSGAGKPGAPLTLGLHLNGRACSLLNESLENYKDPTRMDYKVGLSANCGLTFSNANDGDGGGFPKANNQPVVGFLWTGWHSAKGVNGHPLDAVFVKLQKYAKRSALKFQFTTHELTDAEMVHYQAYLDFNLQASEPAFDD